MPFDLPTFQQVADQIGTFLLFIIIIVGIMAKWWVPGWLYVKMERDRDMWRDLALRGLAVVDKSVTLAEKVKE